MAELHPLLVCVECRWWIFVGVGLHWWEVALLHPHHPPLHPPLHVDDFVDLQKGVSLVGHSLRVKNGRMMVGFGWVVENGVEKHYMGINVEKWEVHKKIEVEELDQIL